MYVRPYTCMFPPASMPSPVVPSLPHVDRPRRTSGVGIAGSGCPPCGRTLALSVNVCWPLATAPLFSSVTCMCTVAGMVVVFGQEGVVGGGESGPSHHAIGAAVTLYASASEFVVVAPPG